MWSPALWWRYFCRAFFSFVPPSTVKNFGYRLTGITIGKRVFIGDGAYFVDAFKSDLIELHNEAVLSPRAIIVAHALPGDSFIGRDYDVVRVAKVIIGEGAWIGAGAVVLPGVTIGKGAIVGANAVVSESVGDFEVWAGNPAKKIKQVQDYGPAPPLG